MLVPNALIAREAGGELHSDVLPQRSAISAITVAAAIALDNSTDVVAQDEGFDPIKAAGGPSVIRI